MSALSWSAEWDLSSVPDDVLQSEMSRRNARKRKSYTGGVLWAKHNPDTKRCRCARCTKKRERAR
jgi:hypothetical protein